MRRLLLAALLVAGLTAETCDGGPDHLALSDGRVVACPGGVSYMQEAGAWSCDGGGGLLTVYPESRVARAEG